MLLSSPLESESHRPPSSLATSVASRSSSARASVGAAAAYPSIRRIANASSTTSTVRGGTGPGGAARAAAATAGAPPATSTSLAMAPPSASRYVSRASVGVEWLEAARRAQKQAAGVAAAPLRQRDLGLQEVDPGVAELPEHLGLDACQQPQRSLQIPRIALGAGRGEQPLRPVRGLRRQRGGALQEGGDRRQPTARLRPSSGTLELARHLLVGDGRRLCPVPGAAIRVELRIGRVRQRAVSFTSLVRLGRAVDRRPYQRMTERHCTVERQQAVRLNRLGGRLRDPELPGRAPQKRGVAERLCRRQEQQPSRVAWEPRQPPPEAPFDPGGQREGRRQAEAAAELGRREPAWELEDRERIAPRLGNDPLQHGLVEARREDGLQ